MNLWLRLIWALVSWRSRGPLKLESVAKRSFRVWPTDLDIFAHMNNGKFLSLADLGRFDWLLRSGTWRFLKQRNWYPVVVAEHITFRKSLMPWQKFEIESKIGGRDEEAFYIEQRFTVKGEIYAVAWVRIRFLVNPRGIVTPHQLIEALGGWHSETGDGKEPQVPAWVKASFAASLLPKVREAAPSEW